jgi:hypothetical protein
MFYYEFHFDWAVNIPKPELGNASGLIEVHPRVDSMFHDKPKLNRVTIPKRNFHLIEK